MLHSTNISPFGDLVFNFHDNGKFEVFSDINRDTTFIIVIKSVDCDLTAAMGYHDSNIGYNHWVFNHKIQIFADEFHPGFVLEIYDKEFQTKLYSKSFVKHHKGLFLNLKSKPNEITYNPYYDLFYNNPFIKDIPFCNNDVVYDLGANIGVFSLMCSNHNVKRVYAFEPHPENFKYLTENCETYGKNITCYEKAVYKSFGAISFGGGLGGFKSIGGSLCSDGEFTVETIPLEPFVRLKKMELPTIFKIDVEGAEYEIIDTLTDSFFEKTHTILFEYHHNDGVNLSKVLSRFSAMGFKQKNSIDFDSKLGTVFLQR